MKCGTKLAITDSGTMGVIPIFEIIWDKENLRVKNNHLKGQPSMS